MVHPENGSQPTSPDDPINAELRADVRRVSTMLGQSLARHHGQDLLDLVEQVRLTTKESKSGDADAVERVRGLLAELPLPRATDLVRAFATYFHLANAAEQIHRVRSFATRAEADDWLPGTVREIVAAGGPELLAEGVAALDVRPVFTAHPTEASRRSILTKLRHLSDELAVPTEPDTLARRRQDRELAEFIDLIWQTDELRLTQPTPLDEARNALYYLVEVFTETLPGLLGEFGDLLADHGVRLDPARPVVRFGSWIGGDRDGNPNVTPEVTAEVLRLQHQRALDLALGIVDVLTSQLSASTAVVPVSAGLQQSLVADLTKLEIAPHLLAFY
ncbi:MAG: phosphoenolpyruvate carboxylase, partial [Propionibacteriaceae bacterium]|nr:phosphoenolpyruvate carboxylase [Propionibacteriaceae bacterium]